MADFNDKLGTLGERSVQRILCRTHYCKLNAEGCSAYKVYSTRANKEMQKNEVDLIEEWIDASGNIHQKGHEVKCEKPPYNGIRDNQKLNHEIGWVVRREKLEQTITEDGDIKLNKKEGFKITGTGNIFVEVEQDVPEGQEATKKNKGWAVVLMETEAAMKKCFSDGRDIWFVQYTPRDVPRNDFQDIDTGVWYRGEDKFGEPYNYFTALQMPDSTITGILRQIENGERSYTLRAVQRKRWGKKYTSRGYTIPITDLYNMNLLSDKKFGREDERTHAVFHQDQESWAAEKKDIGEKWSDKDYIIEPIILCYGQKKEASAEEEEEKSE